MQGKQTERAMVPERTEKRMEGAAYHEAEQQTHSERDPEA